ncbi:MAG: sulfatase family protein [Planctomycetota bacterium]
MTPSKPNIVFVMTDQQNLRGLSCYKGTVCVTPVVDSLAEGGVLYENAYCSYPVCMPSRASFMTGRYPHVNGVRANGMSLPENEIHLPGILKDAGYTTVLCGKNHCFNNGVLNKNFDFIFSDHSCHFGVKQEIPDDFPPQAKEADQFYKDLKAEVNNALGSAVIPFPAEVSDAGLFTEAALRFIRKEKDKPFFLWLSYPGPHWPYTCPEEYADMFPEDEVDIPPADEFTDKPERQEVSQQVFALDKASEEDIRKITSIYYGNCRNIDDQLGRVIAELSKNNLSENTIIIFTSDHGDYLGEHGMLHKSNAFYDCLTKIPYIWYWPGKIKAGHKVSELTENIDFLPTLLDLCDIECPYGVQGISHADGLIGSGNYPSRDFCFSECGLEGPPLSRDDLVGMNLPDSPHDDWKDAGGRKYWQGRGVMARDARYKLCWYSNGDGELYDLQEDPWELVNLYSSEEYKDTVDRLKEGLLWWSLESSDILPVLSADRKNINFDQKKLLWNK